MSISFAQTWYWFVLGCVISYFIGCFNFAVLISKLKQAVGAKTAISPVHPIRSSRCGQSVGISTKLDLLLQMIFF